MKTPLVEDVLIKSFLSRNSKTDASLDTLLKPGVSLKFTENGSLS